MRPAPPSRPTRLGRKPLEFLDVCLSAHGRSAGPGRVEVDAAFGDLAALVGRSAGTVTYYVRECEDAGLIVRRQPLVVDLAAYRRIGGRWRPPDPTPVEAASIYKGALEYFPDSLALCNQAAKFLATYPDAQVRQPDEALRLARHATEVGPRDAMAWSTLGIAHYRNAQWQPAADALWRSMQLSGGNGEAWDWFYLSMALW